MSKRETYRQHAAACLRLAEVQPSPEAKTLLLEMAQRWCDLAERGERGNYASGPRPEAGANGGAVS
jgi:hypothetical protein